MINITHIITIVFHALKYIQFFSFHDAASHASLSFEEWVNISAPFLNDSDSSALDHCRMFDLDYTNDGIHRRPEDPNSLDTIECTEFEYNENLFQVS